MLLLAQSPHHGAARIFDVDYFDSLLRAVALNQIVEAGRFKRVGHGAYRVAKECHHRAAPVKVPEMHADK